MLEWLIQIILQLEVICQFSRHYKQCQIFMEYTNAISPICTYFTRWLIPRSSYDLTRTFCLNPSDGGLGAGLGVGHSYKFIRIGNSQNTSLYEFVRISHLVKYVQIAVRSGWIYMHVYTFFITEWIVLNVDGLHDEKWLRSCEEFYSLSENRLISSTSHMQLVVV